MGKQIAKKIRGMSLGAKIGLVTTITLLLCVFMYQGWYKPQGVQASTLTYGLQTDATTNVGIDGTCNLALASAPTAKTTMVNPVTTAATSYRPTTGMTSGTAVTLIRSYGPVYASAQTITAPSGSFAIRGYNATDTWTFHIYSYNPSGAANNKTLMYSSNTVTSGTGATVTVVPTYTLVSSAMPAGSRLLLEIVYKPGGTTLTPRVYLDGTTNTAWSQLTVTETGADTTKPTVTAFTAPTTSSSLTISGISFTASDNVGVTGYLINESATPPAASAITLASAPTSYTAASAGAKTLYAWVKDAAGNVSNVYTSQTCTITLPDTTKPTVTAFTVPTTSSSLTISGISFTASDNIGVTGYLINESATAPAAASITLASAPTSYTAASAGVKTLYAWVKDAAGNVSNVYTSQTCTITIADTTAPTITAFTVPATSSSLTISGITLTATDAVGVTGYLINESATPPAAASVNLATAPTSYTAASAGAKTLYAWARDAAGNVSAVYTGQPCTITIASDTTKPTVTAFTVPATSSSLVISGITFTASDNVGVTGYLINESATPPAAAAITLAAAPSSYTAASGGTKTLYAWVKDAAGNVSNLYAGQTCTITVTVISPLLHNSANLSTKYGTWGTTFTCTTCHDKNSPTNVKRIAASVQTPTGPRPVVFLRMTASASSIQGAFGDDQRTYALNASTNICEVCHHQTTYHRYSSSLTPTKTHNNRADCTACHNHSVGFKAAGCNGCHPDTGGNVTSLATGALGGAVGAHAKHTGAPLSMVCATCHNGYTTTQMGNTQIEMSFQVNNTNFPQFNPAANVAFGVFSGMTPLSNGYTWVGKTGTTVAVSTNTNASCNVYCHGGWATSGRTVPSWKGAAMACGSCHFTSANPPAAAGDHQVHLGLTGTLALTCANCHPSSGYTTSHLSGSVNWALSGTKFNATSKYKTGLSGATTTIAPSAAYGSCSTTNCHGQLSPVWGGAVGTMGQCQKCHGSQSVLFATVTSAQVAPGTNNIDTGRVTGVTTRGGMHQEHLQGTAGMSEPVKCRECHVPVTAITDAGHLNYSTATLTFSGSATAASHTPTVSRVNGVINCTNTYCHNANRPVGTAAGQSGIANTIAWNNAAWIGGTTIADTCTAKCHNLPPGGGVTGDTHAALGASGTYTTPASLSACSSNSPATGCHPTINAAPTSMLTIFFNKLLHINGTVDGGSCVGCHSKTITRTKGRPGTTLAAATGEFGLAYGHKKTGRGAVTDADCIVCHLEGDSATGKPNPTYHQNGNIDLRDPWGAGETPITNMSNGAFTFQRFSTSYASGSRTSTGHTNNADIAEVITLRFCIRCHSKQGATNPTARSNNGGTGTATMPFGGINLGANYTVLNGASVAGGVVNVFTQFSTANSSVHPVRGPLNRDFPTAALLAVPYKNTGARGTSGTKSLSVVINCFDCHNNNVAAKLTLRTISAHGTANTSQTIGTVYASGPLCVKCHITYSSATNHPTGSAGASVNGDGAEYMATYCGNCHGSSSKSGTPVPARPIPAADYHGFNSLLAGGLWPTVNARPYGFIRNTQNFVYHRPFRGTETALLTGSATCSGGSTQCAGNSGTKTYTPGGSY